jgi:glycosyltransferase involved in cell wall biosynthesis
MRVLFVGTNAGGGGTESHIIALACALADAGHDVSAAVRPDDFIHRALAREERIRLFPAEFRSRHDLRTIQELSRLARVLRPDWIVGSFKAEYWGLTLAAKAANVPLVLFSHLDQRVPPVMLNRVAKLVRAVIVPSEYLRARTIERGLPASRVVVLPNPIDINYFRPDATLRTAMRAQLGLRAGDLVLGYAGRLEPEKGVPTLARAMHLAMARRPNLHALWVGHGKGEQQLHDVVAPSEFASRHHWMPWLDDVRPAYAAMDMLALPSEGSETFGRVLVEAQACGVPVLGARNGGIPEALADGTTGMLLPPGDAASWGEAIADLSVNAKLRRRLATAAPLFARRFDGRRVAGGFIQILESLGDRKAAVRPLHPSTTPHTPIRPVRTAAAD